MADTNKVEFVVIPSPEGKEWDTDYREIPNNVIMVGSEQLQSLDYVNVGLSHTLPQREHMSQICKDFNIPHINMLHIYPEESLVETGRWINSVKADNKADIQVFTTIDQAAQWGYSQSECTIIPHGIDTDHFSGWSGEENSTLTVSNFFEERDSELGFTYYNITKSILSYKNYTNFIHVGKSNSNFSKPAKDYDDLSTKYKTARIFFNPCYRSVIPTTLLEAMSTGMPVVTRSNATIEKLISHGENGLLVHDNPENAAAAIQILLEDSSLCKKMGEAARKTVLEKYNMEKFENNWINCYERIIKNDN